MLGGWTFTSAKIQKYSRTTKFTHKLFYIFSLFNKKNAAKPQSRRDIYIKLSSYAATSTSNIYIYIFIYI